MCLIGVRTLRFFYPSIIINEKMLHKKFSTSHAILDSFCEHVHMALDDLAKRAKGPYLVK